MAVHHLRRTLLGSGLSFSLLAVAAFSAAFFCRWGPRPKNIAQMKPPGGSSRPVHAGRAGWGQAWAWAGRPPPLVPVENTTFLEMSL
ncbi:hypothetical protein CRUP_033055 [Coryphaenoides rupestris]|nr:hypothetical protein CRUP_033055 [Coryphaenoides rupestris]